MESYRPKNLEEILACLDRMTENSKVIGGGTDLIIRLKMGMCRPDALCYLGHVEGLKTIVMEEERIVIGAYATMTAIAEHPDVIRYYPALMDAAADVGSLQIRNNGTIGGNIGNASPAGDLIPVLYLYQAAVEIMGPEGTRMAGIDQVLVRPGRTSLAYNEAITRIFLPKPDLISSFVKLGARKKVTIARIDIALGLRMDGGHVEEICLYAGAIAPKPVRVTEAEEYLKGRALNETVILDAAQILSDLIMRDTPKEFDRDYKVFASRGVLLDAFKRLDRSRE